MKDRGLGAKRILVVEDEPAITEICRRTLSSEGLEVGSAPNGDVAQDMLEKEDYHLCLIDIRTPVMNGRQLYQCIEEKHPKLVDGVIFTTGDTMARDIQSFLEQAGRSFLPKPFGPDELRTVVRQTLKQMGR
jgi:DNA-binding response OmpR family regulator